MLLIVSFHIIWTSRYQSPSPLYSTLSTAKLNSHYSKPCSILSLSSSFQELLRSSIISWSAELKIHFHFSLPYRQFILFKSASSQTPFHYEISSKLSFIIPVPMEQKSSSRSILGIKFRGIAIHYRSMEVLSRLRYENDPTGDSHIASHRSSHRERSLRVRGLEATAWRLRLDRFKGVSLKG